MTAEATPRRNGGARPGAGRPGRDTTITQVLLSHGTAAQLLAVTRAYRASNPRQTQTQTVEHLIAQAFAALTPEQQHDSA